MVNIKSYKEEGLQKRIKFKLSEWYSFWDFSSYLKLKNYLGRISPFNFPHNRNFKYLF